MRMLEVGDLEKLTDETVLEYLPDHPSARGLFEVRRAQGDTIPEAMRTVLEAFTRASRRLIGRDER